MAPLPIALERCSKPSKDLASLLVDNNKKFFWLGVVDFL